MSQAPAYLYNGTVMHQRMQPKLHRFRYKVFNIVVDVTRLEGVARLSPIFSINRFNLLSLFEKDHGPRDGFSLKDFIIQQAQAAEIKDEIGAIYLWCYPRVLGYVFNPLSVYYIYNTQGELVALNYEVRNTFSEMHSYFLPVLPEHVNEAGIRQTTQKTFFVSPFMDVTQTYHFRMSRLAEHLTVRILETQADGSPIFAATFSGRQEEFSTHGILREVLKIPFLTFKIILAIHWEGLKLWLKGIALYDKPKRPPSVS